MAVEPIAPVDFFIYEKAIALYLFIYKLPIPLYPKEKEGESLKIEPLGLKKRKSR